jgi:hypothetical protein
LWRQLKANEGPKFRQQNIQLVSVSSAASGEILTCEQCNACTGGVCRRHDSANQQLMQAFMPCLTWVDRSRDQFCSSQTAFGEINVADAPSVPATPTVPGDEMEQSGLSSRSSLRLRIFWSRGVPDALGVQALGVQALRVAARKK